MILTGATVLVKIIGMVYKIPLGNILGAGGMSHFMSAYSIFTPILALSVAGFPVAVSKLVSESAARGRYRDVRRIFRVGLWMFLFTGMIGSGVMLVGSSAFARAIANPEAALAIAAMAPAVLLCCVMSSFRGYYQGLRNMNPTAVSQIIESLARLGFGILMSSLAMRRGLAEFVSYGTVFGRVMENSEQAYLAVLPYAAAGAVLGVTISTLVGALFLVMRHGFCGDKIERTRIKASPYPEKRGRIAKNLWRISLPVCLAAAVSHIAGVIDVATIMNRISVAILRDYDAVVGQFRGYMPPGLESGAVPSFLYGAFGYTASLFSLIPALTITLGISALPVISAHWALGERRQAGERAASVIKMSAMLAIPAGLGMSVLSHPILTLLYPSRPNEVAIAAPLLSMMGIAAVLSGIATPLMSIFQSVGRVDLPVKLMLLGASVKIVVNYTMLADPRLNIAAAPIGTILCYTAILIGGLIALRRSVGMSPPAGKTFVKPLICGIICAFAAHTCYAVLSRMWDSRMVTLVAISVGGIFYIIFILLLRTITRSEALMLPCGKKIAKTLETFKFLG